ncbi:MAG: hypothetical protein GY906_10405 [bacterium]|nr:hypothetical protein [bacterium]
MTGLRYSAWPFPGQSPFTVKVRDLQAVTGSGSKPKKPIGSGSVEIPKGALQADGTPVINQVLFTDPDDHTNDVVSLIRAHRPGDPDDQPVLEWLTEDPLADADDANMYRLGGRNIEAVLDTEFVEVWDWDGSAIFPTQFPDHIYGGKNVVKNPGLEDPQVVNEVYTLSNDGAGADSFTVTVEGDTTASIDWDATAAVFEAALEATTGISNVLVTGAGTDADPWRIEYVDPAIISPDMSVTDTGMTSTLVKDTEGRLSTAPFTISQTIAQGVNWIHGLLDPGHPFISTAVVRTGTYSLGFNGINQFAGVQQVINVKPGGLYQFSMWANTADTAALWRLVIRTPTEEFVGSSTPFSGTALAASTWTQFTAADVLIPDGVTQVVMRFAYVGTGDPGQVYTDDWSAAEGLAAATPGVMLHDLFDDAQTDHAPGRAALTYINLDFTTVLDSGGNAWAHSALSLTIKRRQSYLQMMRQFEKLGYEWRLVPTSGTPGEWDLQVYNPGGMGADHGGADDPAIVIGQGTLPSNVTRQAPISNYLMAEGKAGLTSRIGDTDSIGAIGRRAQGVFDRRFTDSSDLTDWVTQRLADFLAETLAPRVVITEPPLDSSDDPLWPRPLVEYDTGDIIDYVLADGTTRIERRLESIDFTDALEPGLIWTVSGGSAEPFIVPSSGGGTGSSGPTPYAGGGTGPDTSQPVFNPGYASAAQASQIRVLGEAVSAILEEYRFDEDEPDTATGITGAGIRPAFTVRVAASDARPESQAAADFVCYGTDDWPQIIAAHNICDTLGFGDVVLSEGNFYLLTDLTTLAGVRLRGLGDEITFVWSDPSLTHIFGGPVKDFALMEIVECNGG